MNIDTKRSENMIKRNIRKEEEAVSPIIGTILMVAITVIMAAIISSWSSGIKAPESPKTVGLDISRTNATLVQVTINSIDPPTAVLTFLNFTNASAAGNASQIQNMTNPTVGNTTAFTVGSYNEFVVITARFTDNSVKVLYSQRV